MNTSDFIFKKTETKLNKGSFSWKSPSNIALVKYWGKEALQIPKNPSLSFTLDACFTLTTLAYKWNDKKVPFDFELFFEGEKKNEFKPKIRTFFDRIKPFVPFLENYTLVIKTRNSFPHSSGIASSASGMSALALCIMSMEKALNPLMDREYFYQKASFLARLGSGSAARSLRGSLVVWGKHPDIPYSSDLYGVRFPFTVHPVFNNFHDTILLVDKGQKKVSSTLGHSLMNKHPFAENRFKQAVTNLRDLSSVIINGDLNRFIDIVESEALTLHAMMMTSHPYFILMQPNTLSIIHKIWAFRDETKLPVCFTLDAGANVHVLYPEKHKKKIFDFIVKELVPYCENNQYICDRIGEGSKPFSINQ